MVASVVAIVRRTRWITGLLIRDLSVVRERTQGPIAALALEAGGWRTSDECQDLAQLQLVYSGEIKGKQ